MTPSQGALAGLTVIEMAGLGPCPLAGQLLADHGARVICVDRRSARADLRDVNRRGKQSIALNLKDPQAVQVLLQLIDQADVLIEGFRPGVMEKLGLGPDVALARNPRLIFGRMTGWGQAGPWAQTAGHDLNYLAVTGALAAMGRAGQPPAPPLNLVADYGGGSMFLLFGVLMAVFERSRSGKGQVVDAAMTDGVPAMMGLIHTMLAQGSWAPQRDCNWLDGAAPFYRCYETADGKYLSVGCLEPQFYAEFLRLAGLPVDHAADQNDATLWPARAAEYAAHFKTRSRDDWAAIFDGSDACVAPVLAWEEAAQHPQNADRGTFVTQGGAMQAAPAPRLTRSPAPQPQMPHAPGADSGAVLADLGYDPAEVDALRRSGVLT